MRVMLKALNTYMRNGLMWCCCNSNNKAFVFSAQFTFDNICCCSISLRNAQRNREKKNELQERQLTRYMASIRHDEAKESTLRWDIHLKRLAFSIFTPLML